jgi:hypothetical protein
MRVFMGALIMFLIADIIHRADGHKCTNDCPYPWGKKRLWELSKTSPDTPI